MEGERFITSINIYQLKINRLPRQFTVAVRQPGTGSAGCPPKRAGSGGAKRKLRKPASLSVEARQLIVALTQAEASKRPTARQALKAKFLQRV